MDSSSQSNRAIQGSLKMLCANYWKKPAANTSPSSTRTKYAARISCNFHSVRDRGPRCLWVSWPEEHGAADRGFPGYGAPDEGPRASSARTFCRWARTTSASRGHGTDWLRDAKVERCSRYRWWWLAGVGDPGSSDLVAPTGLFQCRY